MSKGLIGHSLVYSLRQTVSRGVFRISKHQELGPDPGATVAPSPSEELEDLSAFSSIKGGVAYIKGDSPIKQIVLFE